MTHGFCLCSQTQSPFNYEKPGEVIVGSHPSQKNTGFCKSFFFTLSHKMFQFGWGCFERESEELVMGIRRRFGHMGWGWDSERYSYTWNAEGLCNLATEMRDSQFWEHSLEWGEKWHHIFLRLRDINASLKKKCEQQICFHASGQNPDKLFSGSSTEINAVLLLCTPTSYKEDFKIFLSL